MNLPPSSGFRRGRNLNLVGISQFGKCAGFNKSMSTTTNNQDFLNDGIMMQEKANFLNSMNST